MSQNHTDRTARFTVHTAQMVVQVPQPYLTGRRALRYTYVATRGHWDDDMGEFAVE